MAPKIYPERDDILIVRRLVHVPGHEFQDAWDVQTVSGEALAVQCPSRERADTEARRVAQYRKISIFYEHDPTSADSILEFVVTYRVGDAAPVA